ncbi:hypothetical protein EJB05_40170, partial [Eragrostis curvula]
MVSNWDAFVSENSANIGAVLPPSWHLLWFFLKSLADMVRETKPWLQPVQPVHAALHLVWRRQFAEKERVMAGDAHAQLRPSERAERQSDAAVPRGHPSGAPQLRA